MSSAFPTLGLGLTLSPSSFEKRFWNSSTCKNAASYLDWWSLGVNLVVNASLIKWRFKLGDHQANLRLFIVLFFISWGVVQMIWSKAAPENYFKRRSHVLIFNRTFRFATLCITMLSIKRAAATPGLREGVIEAFDRHKLWLTIPTRGVIIRNILCLSNIILVFIHGINTPLPFRQQLALHLLCTGLLLSVQHSSSVSLLTDLLPPEDVQGLCSSFNTAAQMVELVMVGQSVNVAFLDMHCRQHGVSMLVMFGDIYFGLVLPVYVAYRVEQSMEQSFLQNMLAAMQPRQAWPQQAEQDGDPLALAPLILDLLLLALLAVLLWVFVHNWHDLLSLLAKIYKKT